MPNSMVTSVNFSSLAKLSCWCRPALAILYPAMGSIAVALFALMYVEVLLITTSLQSDSCGSVSTIGWQRHRSGLIWTSSLTRWISKPSLKLEAWHWTFLTFDNQQCFGKEDNKARALRCFDDGTKIPVLQPHVLP